MLTTFRLPFHWSRLCAKTAGLRRPWPSPTPGRTQPTLGVGNAATEPSDEDQEVQPDEIEDILSGYGSMEEAMLHPQAARYLCELRRNTMLLGLTLPSFDGDGQDHAAAALEDRASHAIARFREHVASRKFQVSNHTVQQDSLIRPLEELLH